MGRPIDDNYSRNQCALMIRVDGDELYMPLNFNMRADEIMAIYPYLLDMFNNPVPNPSLQFQKDDADGKYEGLSDKERRELLLNMKRMSMLWYNKAEESLLSIALRFAVDIKLRGIEELRHLFETVRPLEKIEAAPLSEEEVERVLAETGMSHPTEKEFDPGDEQDIPLGIAGNMGVNLYGSGAPEDYLSDELDQMESRLKVQDEFQKVADGTKPVTGGYESKYKQGEKLTAAQAEGGLLGMYQDGEQEGSVFDALDREDGLDDPAYDDDYKDFRSNPEADTTGDGDGLTGEPDDFQDGDGMEEVPEGEDSFPDSGDDGEPDFLTFGDEDEVPEEGEDDFYDPEEDDPFPDSGDDSED